MQPVIRIQHLAKAKSHVERCFAILIISNSKEKALLNTASRAKPTINYRNSRLSLEGISEMYGRVSLLAGATTLILGTLGTYSAGASELTYKPVNPNFGGNPFNSQFLLNNATLQNQYLEEDSGPTRRDPLAEFTNTLQRRLLSQISRDITDAIFGENAQDEGIITVGDTTVEFERVGDLVVLQISDAATGNETVIELPALQF